MVDLGRELIGAPLQYPIDDRVGIGERMPQPVGGEDERHLLGIEGRDQPEYAPVGCRIGGPGVRQKDRPRLPAQAAECAQGVVAEGSAEVVDLRGRHDAWLIDDVAETRFAVAR